MTDSTGSDRYVMRISRMTVDKLGVRLYDRVSAVVAELVANAYDADAENVVVRVPLATLLARKNRATGGGGGLRPHNRGRGRRARNDPRRGQRAFPASWKGPTGRSNSGQVFQAETTLGNGPERHRQARSLRHLQADRDPLRRGREDRRRVPGFPLHHAVRQDPSRRRHAGPDGSR